MMTISAGQSGSRSRGTAPWLSVIGPVEDSPYKLNDNYRKILYMKHESYDILLKIRNSARKRETIPDLFRNVFVQYDLT